MNALTFPILKQLSDGQFHSGEALAKRFDVTRVTIWNAIQHAQSLGVEIFSVRGRGYKLPNAVELIDKDTVMRTIGPQSEWFHLSVLDEVDSTNTYLLNAAANGAPHVSCAVAHIQTGGRGRRGRSWVSELGASLTFSLLWRFDCGATALSGLSLAIGVGLVRALKALGVDNVQLKWPNDVLVDQKKLAGILIDLQGGMDGPSAAIIGVGINFNLSSNALKRIDQPAIDIKKAGADDRVSQSMVLGTALKHLVDVLRDFEEHGFVSMREEWLGQHAYQKKTVRMLMPDGRDVEGVVDGVADDGVLLVSTALGVQRFSAGEISLRAASHEM